MENQEKINYQFPYVINTKAKMILLNIFIFAFAAASFVFFIFEYLQQSSPFHQIQYLPFIIALFGLMAFIYIPIRPKIFLSEQGIYFSSVFTKYFIGYQQIRAISYGAVPQRNSYTYYLIITTQQFTKRYQLSMFNLQDQRVFIDAITSHNNLVQLDQSANEVIRTGNITYNKIPTIPFKVSTLMIQGITILVIFLAAIIYGFYTRQSQITQNLSTHVITDSAPNSSIWLNTTSLPQKVIWSSSVTYNGYIYSIGGYSPETHQSINNVYVSSISSNGQISSWNETSSLPYNLAKTGAFVYNGSIFVMGGEFDNSDNSRQTYKSVLVAKILPNGMIGPWEYDTPLPMYLSEASIALDGNSVYIVGCSSCSAGYRGEILHTTINSINGLTAWQTYPAINNLTTVQIFLYNNMLYAIGHSPTDSINGLDTLTNSSVEKSIYSSSILNGLSQWQGYETGEQLRKSSAFTEYNGYLYLLGGRSLYVENMNDSNGYSDVDYASTTSL